MATSHKKKKKITSLKVFNSKQQTETKEENDETEETDSKILA